MLDKHLKYLSGGCFMEGVHERHPTRHIKHHELIIVRSGELHMFEEDQQFHLYPHQFLFLEPNLLHGGTEDYVDELSFYWLHFDIPESYQFRYKTGHFKRPEIAADLASRLLDEQERSDTPSDSCEALMYLLLLETEQIQDTKQQDPNGLVDQAQIFIRKHFRKVISTSDVAQHCNCHPDHLGRLFQARLHQSVSQVIREQRLRHARSLLRDSDLKIEQVAIQSGFSESHYFRRCFKAETGSSPATWRSMHRRLFTN